MLLTPFLPGVKENVVLLKNVIRTAFEGNAVLVFKK